MSESGPALVLIEYPVKTREGIKNELLEARQGVRIATTTSEDEASKKIIVGLEAMRRDVEKSESGEYFASRLLTPFKVRLGEDQIMILAEKYIRRTILEIIYDAFSDYGMGVFRIRFLPEYFLLKKIKARVSFYPPAQRIYWWAADSSSNLLGAVLRRVESELDKLSSEGFLFKDGRYYMINQEVARDLDSNFPWRSARSIKIDSRIANLFRTGKIGIISPLLLISDMVDIPVEDKPLDPEQYAYVKTSGGTNTLAMNQDVYDILNSYVMHEGGEITLTKTGSIFNSTYMAVVKRDSETSTRLFIKRYESWTDVKWVAAKLWAMHLRNFYYSASMRLGNELFYLNYLKEQGLNVPNIIHVDWERKIIIEEAIAGIDLTQLWTKKQVSDLTSLTKLCGETLAKIHRERVIIGDCKPDNFIIDKNGNVWIVDLEQASFKGDPSWDIAECVLYMAHYLDGEMLENYASALVSGYLSRGDRKIVEKALDPRYQLVMMPWAPLWRQLRAVETVRKILEQ